MSELTTNLDRTHVSDETRAQAARVIQQEPDAEMLLLALGLADVAPKPAPKRKAKRPRPARVYCHECGGWHVRGAR